MVRLEDVERVLDRQVRPYLLSHGGQLRSLSLEDGVYRFRLLGRCAGCPGADLTSEEVVAQTLREAFPELRQVVLVQQVSQELLEQARELMGRNRS